MLLVGVVGRHPDVDDRNVRLYGPDPQEVLAVACLADDLDFILAEQPGEALAEQHGVLGDHDAHRTLKVPRS